MFKINKDKNRISLMKQKSFSELGFKEREHLQEWVVNLPSEVFGEELLILQKEFAGFSDTKERLDILALDKNGCLVIIENKLDDSGKDVVWQALKYASYCSSLTKENIKQIYQSYLDQNNVTENAEDKLNEFLNLISYEDIELNKKSSQKIFFLAANFKKEVTSTVLWLMDFEIEIKCFKVTPFSDNEDLYLNFEQIIPIKDAEEYRIMMADKIREENLQLKENIISNSLLLDFWNNVLQKINQTECELFKNVHPMSRRYLGAGSGVSRIRFLFRVTKSFSRIELYIDTGSKEKNIEIFNHFYSNKNTIEKEFGNLLGWINSTETRYCAITYEDSGNYQIEDNWEQMINFLVSNMIKFERALNPYIKTL